MEGQGGEREREREHVCGVCVVRVTTSENAIQRINEKLDKLIPFKPDKNCYSSRVMSVRGRGKEERRARRTTLPTNTNVPLEQQHPTEARREMYGGELRGATSVIVWRSCEPNGATTRYLLSDFKSVLEYVFACSWRET